MIQSRTTNYIIPFLDLVKQKPGARLCLCIMMKTPYCLVVTTKYNFISIMNDPRLVGLWSSRSSAIVAVSKDGHSLSSTLFGCLCNVTKSLKEAV